jgi:hypothetical protein
MHLTQPPLLFSFFWIFISKLRNDKSIFSSLITYSAPKEKKKISTAKETYYTPLYSRISRSLQASKE